MNMDHQDWNDQDNDTDTGTIHPGETVDIPIQLRTSGLGKQAFYMLYRYELWDPESNSNTARHRWLKQQQQHQQHQQHRQHQQLEGGWWP